MTRHPARQQQMKSHSNRLRRQKLRSVLFETLEQRALMASDSLSGFRWSVPTGGASPNEGDPATISWSIVPDGTPLDPTIVGTGNSNFIAFMDGIFGAGATPGAISARPWFNLVSEAYDRWAQVSGLTFVYEPADDGAPVNSANRGVTRVRGDIRLSGRNIDGAGNRLAIGLPPTGFGSDGLDGDTIIDTSDLVFFRNNPTGDNRGFINALAQQTGIALGLGISTPNDNTKLLEAAVSLAFVGPQHDDILSVQTLYGDNNEQLGDPAFSLGLLANGRQSVSQVSIDRSNDTDVYNFSTISSGRLTVRLTPVGQQYLVSSPATTPVPIDTVLLKDLAVQVRDSTGAILAQASGQSIGQIEEILRLNIPGSGSYQIRVIGAAGETQFYTLELIASGFINNGTGVEAPRLLSVAPNSGQILDPNVGNVANANVLTESPRELVFRFSGSQRIDAASLRGIRITRSGGDNVFGNTNDVVVTPSFLGFGDSDRIVVARFGAPLPDDRYRIEVLAVDDAGLPPLQSIDEQVLLPRFSGTDRDTFYMNLELGAKIAAVVPQPVVRQADGSLRQDRDKIEVYFNDDDLDPSFATRPEFYKLILTRDSVTPNDDAVFAPTSVSYDAATDKAVLTFAGSIDELAGGSGTFRLRIGSNRAVASFVAPQIPSESVLFTADVGDTLASASTVLGAFNSQVSKLVNSTVAISATNQLNLDYPGSNFEPGHRDIQDEDHLHGRDVSPTITKILYNFAENRSYGSGSNGQPLFTSINSDQKQRIREIFEFYSAQAGIDIIETQSEGLTIVVGDLFPLNNPPAPFTPAGIAGGGLAIMNGALLWNNGLGGSFFDVSLHEIGHLLGLGHNYELPSGTVMGSTGELDSGNPIEFFFPGDHDIAHLQHIHRPDNRDVDIYKFDIPAGQKGNLVVETIAERLNDSSDLDTHLTLFKRDATGLHIIAVNDNYFSDDSLLRVDLVGEAGAEYFIAVTSRGNESFDPKINGSGSGGISEGRYQLRVDYRPSEVNQILDTSGTPLDGDGDGIAGGDFNFWFRAASPVGIAAAGAPRTIFVDKDNLRPGSDGSLQNPYQDIPSAIAVSLPGDIVRIAATEGLDRNVATVLDNPAYEIGDGGPGKGILSDGAELNVPKGVALMIDAGAIVKLASAEILVGSTIGSTDRSGAAIQILGTPQLNVLITSHFDESIGKDTNLLDTLPSPGQWGGIEIRNDADRDQGRREPELDGVFLNYIGQADIRFGGGQVGQGSQARIVNPIHLTSARPTLLNNKISQSGDAGISADPNSFEETLFTEARYQFAALFTPDYSRVGPDIRGQQITNSSANALSIRFDASPGIPAKTLSVAARLDDTEIAYVIGQNLVIDGTPGGSFRETVGPDFALTAASAAAGGTLVSGQLYQYRMAFVDRFGNEGIPSAQTLEVTPTSTNLSTRFDRLPSASGDFVGRRLYRREGTTGTWDLVSELDRNSPSFTDNGSRLTSGITLTTSTSLQRARPDASLVVDPGVVVKLLGSRIEIGISANFIAEGTMSNPVVFTSLNDDRFGAGSTFDTNNDLTGRVGAAGDWSGIVARHLSTLNIDSARLTFGGGSSAIAGGFAAFSAVEIHQGFGRIANSILEDNASANQGGNRDFRGPNDASTIYVVASQPAIVNNVIRNNRSAAISIDANSLKATPFRDPGRVTGFNNRSQENTGNLGPFVVGNSLGGNALNGMRIRGATLTTESVWDDTDIVHILQSQIVIPDFHTYGGLRLQSKVDESLVVKLAGTDAGITASGRPLDIPTRIGGSLQIIGAPGFPVVLTSIADDTVGAGFDSEGRAMLDTNNNGPSTGVVGGWRSIRLNPYSNDRNLDTIIELESDPVGDANRNDLPANAQSIGAIANNLNGGDENVRLGFTVHGTIAANSDLDTYRFTGTAGTTVWLDLDRTGAALDSVVELIDSSGRIIAQSDNSFNESVAGSVFSNTTLIPNVRAFPMNSSAFISSTSDFQSINPLDAGFRVQLPGVIGTTNSYLVRVRSSNLAPTDPASKLQDLGQVSTGLSSGSYRLQVRLQQMDEIAGSTIRYADVRFATTGIEVLGLPGHSPLISETAEDPTSDTNFATAQNLGNIANSDRAAISIAGNTDGFNDLDWYRFRITRDSIQSEGGLPLGTILDVDYADGLGRPDTTLWVYRLVGGTPQLVLIGTDSNVADDRAAPGPGNSASDLTRGSFGPRDPFIGAQELPDGEYLVAITPASRVESQFQQFSRANATNPLFRIEPISSSHRIADDHFEEPDFPLPNPIPAQQVAFNGNSNAVPFNLSDVTLFVSQDHPTTANSSRLLYANAVTGAREAEGASVTIANDIAVSPAGVVVAATRRSATTAFNDNSVNFTRLEHDGTAITTINSGIDTFEAYASTATPPVFSVTQAQNPNAANAVGDGMEFTALSFAGVGTNNGTLALFGVAKRGNDLPYDQAVITGNPAAITGILPASLTTPYKNILYRLNPDTLIAQSPTGVPNRAGIVAATGTGTSIREHGIFGVTTSTFNNTTGDLIVVTQQAAGDVVGLAQVENTLYGVTNLGELWSMPIVLTSSITQSTRVSAALPLGLTGLTRGPRNVEGGIYANMLFATDTAGRIYAFNTAGVPQAIFPGGNTSILTAGADGLGTVNGIDFAALDVNLWHTTNLRGADAGHGRPANFDRSRDTNQTGETSLYFGYEPTGGNAIPGIWDGIYAPSATTRTYDFAGGAAGAIESNPLDLSSYSVGDKPMLYFNYRLAAENSSGPNTDNNPMRDAFRVYGVMPNGDSVLLATNNSADDNDYENFNNEIEPVNTGNFDAFGTPYRAQVLFDVNDVNTPDQWRQARVPLAALAGTNGVKLRFEFSTGGTFRSADPLRGGVDLGVVPGYEIDDGDNFTITGPGPTGATITRTFAFDHGLVLNLPSGASIRSGDTLTLQGQVFTFVTTATGSASEILFSPTNTPAGIAQSVRSTLVNAGYSVAVNADSPNVLNVNTGSVPLNAAGLHTAPGFPAGTIANPLPVDPTLTLAMPAGSAISAASRLVVEGQTYTFATTATATGAANEIIYVATNSAAQITTLVRNKLVAAGFSVPLPTGANLLVRSGTRQITPTGPHSVTSLPATTIVSLPQAAILTLKIPSGSAITSGSQIVVQGQAFTFRTTATGALNEIVYGSANTAAQVAQLLRNALVARGYTVVIPVATPDTLQVSAGSRLISNAGAFSVTGLDANVIQGLPGVTGSQVLVPVTQAMTAAEVRDAIRQALASTFNPAAQSSNINVWKFQNNVLKLHNYTVDDAGPLSEGTQRPGELFGPQDPVNGSTPTKFAQAFQRSLNNGSEGIFIDDIIIGLAERGEMVVSATTAAPNYVNDSVLTNGGFVDLSAPPNGAYQLEIRTAAEYLLWSLDPTIDPEIGRLFDSNERLSQQVALVVESGSTFNDGNTFTLSDGVNQVTFEFNVALSNADRANGVTSGNVAINLLPNANVEEIVRAIRNAINSSTVQSILKITASADGDEPTGGGSFLNPNQSAVIQLHGPAASDLLGNLSTNLPGLSFRRFGLDSFGEDLGDSNRRRDQGQIVISSNTVRNSRTVGVLVDNAVRNQTALGPFTGTRPYPGSPRNLVTNNVNNLAPGVVIVNNIVASNSNGGIVVSGDTTANAPQAASNIARILNNTVFGSLNGDTGISVNESASATILNNIVSNFTTGISLTGANASSVLGANVYKTNVTQVTGGGIGTFPIALGPLDPLFADISSNRFYLAPLSQAIDSSLANLAEPSALSQVKNSVGLPASTALAPERDVNGILRADDPFVTPPIGQNVAFDRGAVERSDNVKIKAILTGPLDNDSANVDVDRNATYVRLLSGSLDHFSILLTDQSGSGVDTRTVVPQSVVITENGRALTERIDYNFGFNPGSNTIRLTPLSGLWRRDSVYEITLINKPTFRLDTGDGTALMDGDSFTVTLNDGTTRTLEYDSGFMIDVPFTLTGSTANRQTITYTPAGGTSRTFEFTLSGTPLNPSNTPISVVADDTFTMIADKIETALSGFLTGGSFAVDHLGQGRVYVGGVSGDQLQASANFVNITGRPGVTGKLQLQVPATGGVGVNDGQIFSIQSATGSPVTFEFDNNASSGFGTRVISFLTSDSADAIANKIATAIAGAGLGLTPTALPGGVVLLNEPRGVTINLLSSSLTSSGVSGGATSLPYISSVSFSASQIALQTIRVLNQLGQGVKAISLGSGSILIEGITSITGKGTSSLPTIRDVAGNPLDVNRANSLTQFTIVMPDVKMDFGDAPGAGAQTLLTNNGARHTLLPPDASQIFLGSAIDFESDGQPNATSTGDDSSGSPDDEDGVTVNGFFNIRSPETSIVINASGAGFVDAWIDWNRDGDFSDLGEQVITNQIVSQGNSTFGLLTPSTATVGDSVLRVRLSTLGNLLSGGVGVGGEVEDHRIQIIRSFAPITVNDPHSVDEDTTLAVTAPGILSNDSDPDAGQTFTVFDNNPSVAGIQPLNAPSFGTLTLNADGSFQYQPNGNYSGSDSFTYHIVDSFGLRSVNPATVSITVVPVNDSPEFTTGSTNLTVGEDGIVSGGSPGPISIPNFATNIRSAPVGSVGEETQIVSFNLTPLTPSMFATLPSIDANGNLSFALVPNINSDFPALDGRVVVTLSDNGSSVLPNVNTSAPVTFTLTITSINDSPVASVFTRTVAEDGTLSVNASEVLAGALPGPATATDEASQVVSMTNIATSSSQGGTVTPVLSGSTVTSFTYRPAANFVGTDTIEYTLSDNVAPSPATSTGTITITVTAVNDAPVFTISAAVDVDEDQGSIIDGNNQTQVPISINAFATSVSPGPAGAGDEASQTLSFNVVAADPSFFEVQPTIVRSSTDPTQAILMFTLAKHRNNLSPNGSNNLVRVSLVDSESGVAPQVNTSPVQTFSINIRPVNDAPISSAFAPTVSEDSATIFTAAEILAGATAGPTGADDEFALQVLSIVNFDSRSNQGGVITQTGTGTSTGYRYLPAPNFVGQDTFTYTLSDNAPGTPRTAIGTITVTVTALNDAPEFTLGNTVVIDEDAGAYSQPWATNVLPGPSNARDENSGASSQTVTFEVTTDSPSLFKTLPSIDATGRLSFEVARNASGNAVVSVTAIDSGSGTSPNVNRSAPASFTISITPVNDAPAFVSGGDVTVREDAGAVNQDWATAILAAAPLGFTPPEANDESTQTVSFIVTGNSNAGLFSIPPAVASDGKLSFTTAPNAIGSSVITIIARDNGSSTSPNTSDSQPVTITINLTAENDAPIGVGDRYLTSEDALLTTLEADGVINNDSDPDHPRNEFSVVPGNITSAQGASIVMASNGSFTYDPRSAATLQRLLGGATLDDTFTYRLQDASGAVSQPITVTVTVQGANDAPTAANDVLGATPNGTTLLNVLTNDTDPDSPIDVTSVQLGVLPANGSVAVLADGRFSYTPNSGFRGSDSFSYRVRDSFGVLSNEGIVTVRINNPPVAVADRASVLAGSSVVINVLNNDTDGDGVSTINRSSVIIVSNSPNGTATVLSDGTIRFTPSSSFTSGTTTFTYSIKDSENPPAESAPGVVTIDAVQSLYQNATNRFDVNNDGFVSPVDALIVINDLNRRGSRPLPAGSFTPPPFIDVNGSASVEPIDVLQVINYLNRQSRGLNAEGERTTESVAPVVVIAAPSNVDVGLPATTVDVMTVTPEQVMQAVAQQVTQAAQQRLRDAAISLDLSSDDEDSIAVALSDSLTLRKRSMKTDSVFAESIDQLWD